MKDQGSSGVIYGNNLKDKRRSPAAVTLDCTPESDILYRYNYSTNSYTGTLYLYKGGKAEKLDNDAMTLISVYNNHIKGGMYYGW